MKIENKKLMILSTILCLLPILLGVALYDRLPEMIPTHFDFHGNVDGYTAKAYFVFGFPVFMAAMNLFLFFMLDADPKKQNASSTLRLLSRFAIPVMTLLLMPASLFIALGANIPVQTLAPVFCSVIFILTGNYLPKTRQNYTVGIKLPWTLDSEENWKKTHRLAGYLWMAGGVLILIGGLLKILNGFFFMTVMIVMIGIPTIYSYMLFKKGI